MWFSRNLCLTYQKRDQLLEPLNNIRGGGCLRRKQVFFGVLIFQNEFNERYKKGKYPCLASRYGHPWTATFENIKTAITDSIVDNINYSQFLTTTRICVDVTDLNLPLVTWFMAPQLPNWGSINHVKLGLGWHITLVTIGRLSTRFFFSKLNSCFAK